MGISAGGKGRIMTEGSRENSSKGLGNGEYRQLFEDFLFYTGKERKHSSGGSRILKMVLIKMGEVIARSV